MKHSPSILMVLEGVKAVDAVRLMTGVTYGIEATPGTIRGDFSMSLSHTIVHASDSPENAEKEIERFFKDGEIFPYKKIDWAEIYNSEEREQ
jgi:nucleoside-diphosphate kinase